MKLLGKRSVASFLKVILDGLFFLTIVFGVLAVFFLLLAALSGNTGPHDEFINLGIPYSLEHSGIKQEIQPIDATLGGMEVGMEISRELALNLTKWWFLLLIVIFMALIIAVLLYILLQLRHILASLTEGNPFTLKNAQRIRLIGIVIIAGELLTSLVMIGSALIINANVDTKGFQLIWMKLVSEISLSTIFLGIVVLIIAEIFRLGVRLREDQELTI